MDNVVLFNTIVVALEILLFAGISFLFWRKNGPDALVTSLIVTSWSAFFWLIIVGVVLHFADPSGGNARVEIADLLLILWNFGVGVVVTAISAWVSNNSQPEPVRSQR